MARSTKRSRWSSSIYGLSILIFAAIGTYYNNCIWYYYICNIHTDTTIAPSNYMMKTTFNIYDDINLRLKKDRIKKINKKISKGVNEEYLNHLSSLPPIPKKIHISWKNKNVLQSKTKIIEFGIKNLKKMNADWNFTIYDDNEVEEFIKEKISSTDYDIIKTKHIIEKLDLWRLLIMYFEGGYYQDIDRLFNIPLNLLIDNRTKMLLPTYINTDFAQDIMCSSPFNNLFKFAIELNLSKRRRLNHSSTWWDILTLGPVIYLKAITKTLFNISTPRNHYIEKMRNIIQETKFIKTYQEIPHCNRITYHQPNISKCMEAILSKEALWNETNVKQWNRDLHH